MLRFVTWYNTEHRHSAIKFVTPAQRHYGQEALLLQARQQVYEAARQAMPQRWKGRPTRDWRPAAEVWLNPEKQSTHAQRNLEHVA